MSKKIYTKTGDTGITSIVGGARVSKGDLRIEAYGNIDEVNSWIGLINDSITNSNTKLILTEIQDRLFTIGSSLASESAKKNRLLIPDLHESDVTILEKEMDKMNETLPEIKHFILPGGHANVSLIHIARCVCRRAERSCVNLKVQFENLEPLIIKYLNRLSDYLFVFARYLSKSYNAPEYFWKPRS